jgi:hypothetical protein
MILDSEEIQFLTDRKVKLELKRFKGVIPARIAENIPIANDVHIHLPNTVLHGIRTVYLLEDCCTDRLQEHLDNGWQILCICPPLNKRRPDYILGKP